MEPLEILVELLLGVAIEVTFEQINELIEALISGSQDLVMTGDRADMFTILSKGFNSLGVDPSSLTDDDWYGVAKALVAAA